VIRYSTSLGQLEQLIQTERSTWLGRARARTDTFEALGHYEESSSIWSEIKVVYMRLQHNKCAYCERQLEAEFVGRGEHDVEHFRPKKKARPWRLTADLREAGVTLTPPVDGPDDPGYHLLAYHPLNYCTACKSCNSGLKGDYFPIGGTRVPDGSDPAALRSEVPWLIYPIGDVDDDPEDLISFHGLSPMAKSNDSLGKKRGLMTIAFFRLDDRRRKSLFRERARIIISLFSFRQNGESAAEADQAIWHDLIDALTTEKEPHTNCARSFKRLCEDDSDEAEELFRLAATYLQGVSS